MISTHKPCHHEGLVLHRDCTVIPHGQAVHPHPACATLVTQANAALPVVVVVVRVRILPGCVGCVLQQLLLVLMLVQLRVLRRRALGVKRLGPPSLDRRLGSSSCVCSRSGSLSRYFVKTSLRREPAAAPGQGSGGGVLLWGRLAPPSASSSPPLARMVGHKDHGTQRRRPRVGLITGCDRHEDGRRRRARAADGGHGPAHVAAHVRDADDGDERVEALRSSRSTRVGRVERGGGGGCTAHVLERHEGPSPRAPSHAPGATRKASTSTPRPPWRRAQVLSQCAACRCRPCQT